MKSPTLSVVIGTYNRIDSLSQCLESLLGKIKVQHEIIVVDAGSTDGTLDYLGKLPGIRLVCDHERIGQAQSLNRVFKTLQSKYVCWLSDDNVVVPGMLDQAVSILRSNRTIGMVGLKVKDVTGPGAEQPYLGGIWLTGVLNCNQGILPVQLLKKLGGFDEQFRDYGIDIDLTTQVLLEGYKVVLTKNIAVYHLRDHETESWTDSDGRKQKLEHAQTLYQQKFESLIESEFGGPYDKYERRNSPQLKQVYHYYARLKKGKIPPSVFWMEWVKKDWRILLVELGRRKGLIGKDWRNLLMARFVSKWDFLIHSMKPYYLVQRIPRAIRKQLQGEKK